MRIRAESIARGVHVPAGHPEAEALGQTFGKRQRDLLQRPAFVSPIAKAGATGGKNRYLYRRG